MAAEAKALVSNFAGGYSDTRSVMDAPSTAASVGAITRSVIDVGAEVVGYGLIAFDVANTFTGIGAGPDTGIVGAAILGTTRGAQAAKGISNPVPSELARVIPGRGSFPTLGPPTRSDVFVTAADDIAGLNANQIAQRLTIPQADTLTVIRFPTPQSGLASPVNRLDPGFVGSGRTAGGAREFVLPNGPIPAGTRIEVIGP